MKNLQDKREELIKSVIEMMEEAIDDVKSGIDERAYALEYPEVHGRLAIVIAWVGGYEDDSDPCISGGYGLEISLRHSHTSFFLDDWYYAEDCWDHWDGNNNFHSDKMYFPNDEGGWNEQECEVPECEGGCHFTPDKKVLRSTAEWVVDKYLDIMRERVDHGIEI